MTRWLTALKPASWPKLLVPALLGQALGVGASEHVSVGALVFGIAFSLCDIAFIVLLNDWADRDVDALKRRMFPNAGSPKTIPDGLISAPRVLAAGLAAGALGLLVCLSGAVSLGRPALAVGGALALAVFGAYSLPPLRLNYRGGGELLEMVGVGLLLPWLNATAQDGALLFPTLVALPGFALLALASAVASGLSDEQSDRRGGKRTVVTALGNRPARRIVEALVPAGASAWVLASIAAPHAVSPWGAIAAAVVVLVLWAQLRRLSAAAVTNAFREQGAYKQALHRAIWWSVLVLSVGVVATR